MDVADSPELTGLAAIYQQCRPQLLRFLRARTADPSEADDIIQELWIKLQNSSVGPVANGRAYLFQVANNLVLDRVRERRRRSVRDRRWTEAAYTPAALQGEVIDPQPDPERALLEAEELQRLTAAVAGLPEGARRAFCLHKIDGLSHAEVAARLGISRSGVEKHIAVAMKHLRQAMQG
jgi:RNA polymerase sigma factor (sigma-70 family)